MAKKITKKGAGMAAMLLTLGVGWLVRSRSAPLKAGDAAPDFTLSDQNGKAVSLHDFRGKKAVVLAFYIKAFTPG